MSCRAPFCPQMDRKSTVLQSSCLSLDGLESTIVQSSCLSSVGQDVHRPAEFQSVIELHSLENKNKNMLQYPSCYSVSISFCPL